MKWIGKIILMACLAAVLNQLTSWADDEKKSSRSAKKVFTNEDLEGMRGSDPASKPKEDSDLQSSKAKDGDKTKDAATSAADPTSKSPKTKEQHLQEIQTTRSNLKNAKLDEIRAIKYLAVYQKKFQEAQDQFHKETAEAQARDMEFHVTRLGEERKKLEAQLEKMNKAAREAGIKEEELREKEAEPSSLPGTAETAQPPTAQPPTETPPAPTDNPSS